MKKLFALILVFIFALLSVNAFAVDTLRVIRSGKLVQTTSPVVNVLTLSKLIANVTTSNTTITTGNYNIPVTVNGTLLYIKAHSSQ